MSYLPPKWSIPSDVEWIEINGCPMAYQDSGAGAPLILVHGSLCDYRMWPGQLEAFSKKHRVLNVPALSSLRRPSSTACARSCPRLRSSVAKDRSPTTVSVMHCMPSAK